MKPKQRMALRIITTVSVFLAVAIGIAHFGSSVPTEVAAESDMTVLSVAQGIDSKTGKTVYYITTEEHGPQRKIQIPESNYMRFPLRLGEKYRFLLYTDKRSGEPTFAVRMQ